MRGMNMNVVSRNAFGAARMWWWQSSLWREFTLKFYQKLHMKSLQKTSGVSPEVFLYISF